MTSSNDVICTFLCFQLLTLQSFTNYISPTQTIHLVTLLASRDLNHVIPFWRITIQAARHGDENYLRSEWQSMRRRWNCAWASRALTSFASYVLLCLHFWLNIQEPYISSEYQKNLKMKKIKINKSIFVIYCPLGMKNARKLVLSYEISGEFPQNWLLDWSNRAFRLESTSVALNSFEFEVCSNHNG